MKEGEIFNYAEQEYPECLKMAAKIEFLHKRKTLEIVFIELGFWFEGFWFEGFWFEGLSNLG